MGSVTNKIQALRSRWWLIFPVAVAVCVVWADAEMLTFSTPVLLGNRDNLDIPYPLFDFFIDGLRHGHINVYQPFMWAGTRLFGDPNFQINMFEVITGLLFGTKGLFIGLNFMFLAERIAAALGMYALIGAVCPNLPRYLRAILSLLYVFSFGYLAAEPFPSTSVHFAVAPWLLFVLIVSRNLSALKAFAALTAMLFVQFSYGQLQFTVYLGWLSLSFALFYLPRADRFHAVWLLSAAAIVAALLSAYYVIPLIDNLYFSGNSGTGGRVIHALDISAERVPFFYFVRIFVPNIFGGDIGWWPTWRNGWSLWESFSAFQGVVLSLLVIVGLFVKRVPLYFRLTYLFIAATVSFPLGLSILHFMNFGSAAPYGRQTVLLGLIAPIIAAFTLEEMVKNRKIATAFAIWCGVWCLGLLTIYGAGFPKFFVRHVFASLKHTFPDAYSPGEAARFYDLHAHALQMTLSTPAILTGLAAISALALVVASDRYVTARRPTLLYGAATVICLLSLGQAIAVYHTSRPFHSNGAASKISLSTKYPLDEVLVATGASVANGPVMYRLHSDIYFGEHRQGTDFAAGNLTYRLPGAQPPVNRFQTLSNFLAS
ncbi:MAG TPA: hypothetical protein VFD87_06110, partial [Phototrophicaceae bacterium]|nr:hypothetical protein [Phototrophicaceae bacterium]